MPCMTHVISFYHGKSHINGPKKLGTMMLCMTYVISFYFGKNTSSCIVLRHLALSCIILHCLASSCIILPLSCIILHCLASSCIVLHHLASSCIVLHHLAHTQLQPKFARPRLCWRQQDFHKGAAQLCYSEPFVVGSYLHTTHSSQVAKLIS